VRRHGGRVEGVIIIEVEVPRRWLRRNRKRLWYSTRDIPPENLRRLVTFAELAGRSGAGRGARHPLARAGYGGGTPAAGCPGAAGTGRPTVTVSIPQAVKAGEQQSVRPFHAPVQ
jgi:hypothetical protein